MPQTAWLRTVISGSDRTPLQGEDVIAGVRVTGTADEQKAEIFSDPAMSQQMALSYLQWR